MGSTSGLGRRAGGPAAGRRPARVVLLAVVLAAATGCTSAVRGRGTIGPPPPPTARGATYLAMLDLAAASAVRYRGSFDSSGDTVDLDATVTSSGDATGTLTADGDRIGLLVLQGVSYLRAPEAFWAIGGTKNGITRRYGSHWVRVPPKLFGLDVAAVLAPAALARSQHPVIPAVPDEPVSGLTAGAVRGARTVVVEAQGTRYDLSAGQPYRLLRLSVPAVPRVTAGPPRPLAARPPPPAPRPAARGPEAGGCGVGLPAAARGVRLLAAACGVRRRAAPRGVGGGARRPARGRDLRAVCRAVRLPSAPGGVGRGAAEAGYPAAD